ncbi:MAG: hypothetical protein LQ342_007472 [Letrouitia transgressa]|nr:MAG: hypothetical protein LQ342_007472 [Letrouitia transgressa]
MTSGTYYKQPTLFRQQSDSSFLIGIEKHYPSNQSSPATDRYQDPIDMYLEQRQFDKPLPPTPRRPSSVYSMQRLESHRFQHNQVLPPAILLTTTKYRSSTSKLPDQTPARPELIREADTHAISDSLIETVRSKQGALAVPNPTSVEEYGGHKLKTTTSQENIKFDMDTAPQYDATDLAENYTAVLHTQSSTLARFTWEPYIGNSQSNGYLPSPMSPRIIDVVDHSLVPAPLLFGTFEECQRPLSHFSTSSSSTEESRTGIKDSIRSIARRALSLRDDSENEIGDTDSATIAKGQHGASHTPQLQSRVGSSIRQRRLSLQHGIGDMYDTLASWTSASKRSRPGVIDIQGSASRRAPRMRSSAVPLSSYQVLGTKAWQVPPQSSKGAAMTKMFKSTQGNHIPAPPKNNGRTFFDGAQASSPWPDNEPKGRSSWSVVSKVASMIQTGQVHMESAVGLNTSRVKRSRSEKRRAELKNKIVVVKSGNTNSVGGRLGHWV